MTPWHCRDLKAWNHAALRTFGDIAVEACAPGFEATLAARDWPGLRLARAESPAAHVRGGQGGARPGWLSSSMTGACAAWRKAAGRPGR